MRAFTIALCLLATPALADMAGTASVIDGDTLEIQRNQAMWALEDFVRESNRIEGILRDPTKGEIGAHERLSALDKITVPDLKAFVKVVQPDAALRRWAGQDVRVSNHIAPPGGPEIEMRLENILDHMLKHGAYKTHLAYEDLHPFTDGNGRSGRALWLWQMGGEAPIGFLHRFYYQTLDAQRH